MSYQVRQHPLRTVVIVCSILSLLSIPTSARLFAQIAELPPDQLFLPLVTNGEPMEAEVEIQQVLRVYFDYADDLAYLSQNFDVWEEAISRQDYVTILATKSEQKAIEEQGYEFQVNQAMSKSLSGPAPRFGHSQLFEDNSIFSADLAAIPGYSCYRTVEETYTSLADLAAANPNLATWSDIGDSWDKLNSGGPAGYDIYALKLTSNAVSGPKPPLMIISAIHAREYTTAEMNTRFAEYLVSNYGVDPDITWLLDYNEIHILPQANPDGRKIAEGGELWRKNTNITSGCSSSYGVDLNRNSSFKWGGDGSSSSPCNDTYRGPTPASEPEVKAIQNYAAAIFADQRGPGINDPAPADTEGVFITIHSFSELVLYPWGWTNNPAPNNDGMATLGRKFGYFNGYVVCNDCLYTADGVTDDFTYGEFGVPSYTFELGTSFFQGCSAFENTIFPDNLPALIYAAKAARRPYQTPSGPDAVNPSLADPIVTAGTSTTLRVTIDDTRTDSNGQGNEPTQSIRAARYTIDAPSWTGATAYPLTASDGNFNSTTESVTGAIDTTGLAAGAHTIFIEGQDADRNWGPPTAIEIEIEGESSTPATTIFFDDFETDLGWVINPNGTDTATHGQWERGEPQDTNTNGPKQLGATVSGSNNLVTGRLAGGSVGAHDIDNGETSARSPAFTIPTNGDTTLSFSYYMAHTDNSSTGDYLRVKVVGTSPQIVQQELGDTNDDDGAWQNFSTSLNSFAGETVYLLVEAADGSNGSIVEAALDDVRVASTGDVAISPEPTDPPPATSTPRPTAVPAPTNTPVSPNPPAPIPSDSESLYVSSTSGGNIGDISFNDEDIMQQANRAWRKFLDMSNVSGITEINAFALLDDGSILVSYAVSTTVAGIAVDDSDILRFTPSSIGNGTAGTFELYFDGSTAGLTTNGEDIDAITLLDNGDLIISTIGNHSVPGISGRDEDLLRYSGGTWTGYFDGSDIGLTASTEDIYGVWIDESSGEIYFTTRGSITANGVSGDGADIFVCDPSSLGNKTSCSSLSLYWDGSAEGYGDEAMDALHISR